MACLWALVVFRVVLAAICAVKTLGCCWRAAVTLSGRRFTVKQEPTGAATAGSSTRRFWSNGKPRRLVGDGRLGYNRDGKLEVTYPSGVAKVIEHQRQRVAAVPPLADQTQTEGVSEAALRAEFVMNVMTSDELKALLRSRRLPMTGSKAKLATRLVEHVGADCDESHFMTFLTVDELKVLNRARGLKVTGTKDVLIAQLVLLVKRVC